MFTINWKEMTFKEPYKKYEAINSSNKIVAIVFYNPDENIFFYSHNLFFETQRNQSTLFSSRLELAKDKINKILDNFIKVSKSKDLVWIKEDEDRYFLVYKGTSISVGSIIKKYYQDDEGNDLEEYDGFTGLANFLGQEFTFEDKDIHSLMQTILAKVETELPLIINS